ncbi:MAG: Asp-tRNA(Asn)/Glu-tRNA(Gln) amidotransferase subunit GatC [Candidatus Margulisiibacteriota bacterium]
MVISKTDVEHIARLANLAVSEEEKELLTKQLDDIFEYASELNKLDTEGIEPTAHAIPQKTPFREDVVDPFPNRQQLINNAPDEENGFFAVPKM